MKNLMLMSALMLVGAVAKAAGPAAPVAATAGKAIGQQGYVAVSIDVLGANHYNSEVGAAADTPVLLFAGSGVVYGVSCSSGEAGDFGLAIDAAASGGVTVNSAGAVAPEVLSSQNSASACSGQQVCGQWQAPGGKGARVQNGLVFLKHGLAGAGANMKCIVYARADADNATLPAAK